MKHNLKVNMVSETVFLAKENGVHSAFVDMVNFLRKIGVEVKINSKDKCDVTHIHTVGLYSLLKYIRSNKKVIISAHIVPDSLRGSLKFTKIWLGIFSVYLKFFYNRAKVLIAVSPYTEKELKKMKVTPEVKFLPSGVNRDWFKKSEKWRKEMRNRYKMSENEFVIVGAGQIQPRKGIKTFVESARRLPQMKFVWIGSRPFGKLTEGYQEMNKLMKGAPENVIFTGGVDYEDMPKFYNMADVFFLPSIQETFGLVVNEAASTGLPVVLRNLEVYKGIFGNHYIRGEENNFIDIFKKLMQDKDYYDKWKKQGEQLAHEYDGKIIAKRLLNIYQTIL